MMAFACLIVLGVLVVNVVAVVRLVQIARDSIHKYLVPRSNLGGLIGFLGVTLLVISLLAEWGTVAFTASLFFRKIHEAGDASGIPMFLAMLAFPFAYGLSELLVRIGMTDS